MVTPARTSSTALTDWPLLGAARAMPCASPTLPTLNARLQTLRQSFAAPQSGSKRPLTDSGPLPAKRSLPNAYVRPPTPQSEAIRADLTRNLHSLAAQMASLDKQPFKVDEAPMRYQAMRAGGFRKTHGDFLVFINPSTVFINAGRPNDDVESGDKLHVSVDGSQVESAFDALAGLLFSSDSPINQWKVTDMSRLPSTDRVAQGAQLTLFINPRKGARYGAQHLRNVREFIDRIETTLTDQGVEPGIRPESDVASRHWRYVSYRNEFACGRAGSEAHRLQLAQEPFFKLIGGEVP